MKVPHFSPPLIPVYQIYNIISLLKESVQSSLLMDGRTSCVIYLPEHIIFQKQKTASGPPG